MKEDRQFDITCPVLCAPEDHYLQAAFFSGRYSHAKTKNVHPIHGCRRHVHRRRLRGRAAGQGDPEPRGTLIANPQTRELLRVDFCVATDEGFEYPEYEPTQEQLELFRNFVRAA